MLKQSNKLKFVVKEVVIQRRIRGNWTESKRSKDEQEAFKQALVAYYISAKI
jgi:hypothetical protein